MSGALTCMMQFGAALSACAAGGALGVWQTGRRQERARRVSQARRVRQSASAGDVYALQGQTSYFSQAGKDAAGGHFRALRFAEELSQRLSLGASTAILGGRELRFASRWFENCAHQAGEFTAGVSKQGFVEASLRLGAGGALLGAALGAVFSNELMLLAAVAGFALGVSSVARDVKAAIKLRRAQLAKSLPEMLEVVALGLRSGLSFDRSFGLYAQHFSTVLSLECGRAWQLWATGLSTREQALRKLAGTYDSALFTRVIEGVVRSLRFGSSMTEMLEQAASEARAEHRSLVEERVAKAPVKMMIPTGTLILPAMLLLVLGPVLLELMGGF